MLELMHVAEVFLGGGFRLVRAEDLAGLVRDYAPFGFLALAVLMSFPVPYHIIIYERVYELDGFCYILDTIIIRR